MDTGSARALLPGSFAARQAETTAELAERLTDAILDLDGVVPTPTVDTLVAELERASPSAPAGLRAHALLSLSRSVAAALLRVMAPSGSAIESAINMAIVSLGTAGSLVTVCALTTLLGRLGAGLLPGPFLSAQLQVLVSNLRAVVSASASPHALQLCALWALAELARAWTRDELGAVRGAAVLDAAAILTTFVGGPRVAAVARALVAASRAKARETLRLQGAEPSLVSCVDEDGEVTIGALLALGTVTDSALLWRALTPAARETTLRALAGALDAAAGAPALETFALEALDSDAAAAAAAAFPLFAARLVGTLVARLETQRRAPASPWRWCALGLLRRLLVEYGVEADWALLFSGGCRADDALAQLAALADAGADAMRQSV